MNFVEDAAVSGVKETSEGYLIADCYAVRAGIQTYAGYELGMPEVDIVRVYRPASEVFRRDSLQSFSHVPVTVDHPAQPVTADNWKDLAVGEASADVVRDGERLRIPLILKDKTAVAAVRGDKRQLSAGYTCTIDFSPGVTQDGQAYDAVQRNIRANHIALVDNARAGQKFRFGDSDPAPWGAAPINQDRETPMTLKTIMHDGVSIQTTDQGAQVIEKLAKTLADAAVALDATKAEHAKALADKDAEIARRDAEIDAAKAKVLSDADLDQRVAARADLVAKAKGIAPDIETAGLSDAAIRKAVVKAKLGDAVITGKADAYIDARFDILAEDTGGDDADPVRKALKDGKPADRNDNGQAAYEKRLTDAWRAPAARA